MQRLQLVLHFLAQIPAPPKRRRFILNGVKADQWRILGGPDAHKIDELVRRSPERIGEVLACGHNAHCRESADFGTSRPAILIS